MVGYQSPPEGTSQRHVLRDRMCGRMQRLTGATLAFHQRRQIPKLCHSCAALRNPDGQPTPHTKEPCSHRRSAAALGKLGRGSNPEAPSQPPGGHAKRAATRSARRQHVRFNESLPPSPAQKQPSWGEGRGEEASTAGRFTRSRGINPGVWRSAEDTPPPGDDGGRRTDVVGLATRSQGVNPGKRRSLEEAEPPSGVLLQQLPENFALLLNVAGPLMPDPISLALYPVHTALKSEPLTSFLQLHVLHCHALQTASTIHIMFDTYTGLQSLNTHLPRFKPESRKFAARSLANFAPHARPYISELVPSCQPDPISLKD